MPYGVKVSHFMRVGKKKNVLQLFNTRLKKTLLAEQGIREQEISKRNLCGISRPFLTIKTA